MPDVSINERIPKPPSLTAILQFAILEEACNRKALQQNFSLKTICLELRIDVWEEEDVGVRMCLEIGSEEWELGRREVGLRAHMHMVMKQALTALTSRSKKVTKI